MSEALKLFGKIPYKVKTVDSTFLSIEQAEEALEDIYADTESMIQLPPMDEIIEVSNENMFGFYRLNVTIYKDSQHPEYMLNARVADLEPTLINVTYESAEVYKPQESATVVQEPERVMPEVKTSDSEGKLNIVQYACQEFGMNYEQLSQEIGFSAQTLDLSVSSEDISKPLQKSVELFLENRALKKELENSRKIKNVLKEWLNS